MGADTFFSREKTRDKSGRVRRRIFVSALFNFVNACVRVVAVNQWNLLDFDKILKGETWVG